MSMRKAISVQFRSASTLSEASKHRILVVGGGSGGLSVAHQIYNRFKGAGKPLNAGDIAIVDGAKDHYYQPGWTLVGSGLRPKSDFRSPLASLISKDITLITENVKSFSPGTSTITTESGRDLGYDVLVVATGLKTKWDAIQGLPAALLDPNSGVSSIYSYDTCDKVWNDVEILGVGQAVFTQPAGVIKCAGAPQKIMWMAWDRFRRTNRLDNIKVSFYTGMPTMFSVKKYSDALDALRVQRGVGGYFSHNLESIDVENRMANFKSADGSVVQVGYSLLHVTPPMGPLDVIATSPIADRAGWVEVNQETLQHVKYQNIFSLGDCSSLPTSKTAAAITAQAPVLTENLFSILETGKIASAAYDGYTSCPLLTGYGELMLAEFKYGLVPKESFGNLFDQAKSQRFFYHLKKDLFPWAYWNYMRKVVREIGPVTAHVLMPRGGAWEHGGLGKKGVLRARRDSMSRLTTAQVVSLGHYLEPDFDPASLTVSQLLGVLGYHNIKYPTPYSKPKLIQLFNEEIKTRSSKFKKERIKKENSIASDEGIKDGLTGQLLAATRRNLPVRRSSRRLSQAPSQDQEASPIRQELPKRRRASAQPGLAGPSKTTLPVHPALAEESESEVTPERKVIRSKKSDLLNSENRAAQLYADDSGWEDNNIFQSGAEDSSPARPSPAKARAARKSLGTRRSRKSSSAPPQVLPFSSPIRDSHRAANVKFPEAEYEPEFPVETPAVPKFERPDSPFAERPSTSEFEEDHDLKVDDEHIFTSPKREQVVLPGPRKRTDIPQELPILRSPQETKPDVPVSSKRGPQDPLRSRDGMLGSFSFFVSRLFVLGLVIGASAIILKYKAASMSIGYCERGRDSNEYLDAIRAQASIAKPCDIQKIKLHHLFGGGNDTAVENECSLTSLFHLTTPQRCTVCPDHATCSQYGVTCDTSYILRPHLLLGFLPTIASSNVTWDPSSPSQLIWKTTSVILDGLPGFGSIALPSRCLEDPRRKHNIGALGKAIEALLGQERGMRLCAGGKILSKIVRPEEGGEAKKWGVELRQLRETMRKKTSPHLLASFDDTFNEAMQQLVQWGNVVAGEDQDGRRYLAHGTPHLTLTCTLIVKAREAWAEWRATVFGCFFLLLLAVIERARRVRRRAEAKRVAELVQTALNSLRNQEIAHHTDPITAPQPFLSSLQLRDLVLQDEHSIPVRKRLWDQVEHVVEENANVRVNLREVQGGDEMRVWRWVGSGRATGQADDA